MSNFSICPCWRTRQQSSYLGAVPSSHFHQGTTVLNVWKKMEHLEKDVLRKRDFQMTLNASGLSGKHSFELRILLDFSDFSNRLYKIPQIHCIKAKFSQIGKLSRFPSPFHSSELTLWINTVKFCACSEVSTGHCLLIVLQRDPSIIACCSSTWIWRVKHIYIGMWDSGLPQEKIELERKFFWLMKNFEMCFLHIRMKAWNIEAPRKKTN